MKSTDYLDRLIKKSGLKNDAQLCKLLGWSSARISQYRTGKNIMDNEACGTVAIHLGIDPMEIIRTADLDRAEKLGQTSFWNRLNLQTGYATARTLTAAAILGLVTLFLTPTPSEAAPVLKPVSATIYIM